MSAHKFTKLNLYIYLAPMNNYLTQERRASAI